MVFPLMERTACARSIDTVVGGDIVGHDISQAQDDGELKRYDVCDHVKGLAIKCLLQASISTRLACRRFFSF